MKVEIRVPSMGESIAQATIGTIIKPTGSYVKTDDELIELETDKVNQVLYAKGSGVVSWSVASQQTVAIGDLIGTIDTDQKVGDNSTKPQIPAPEKIIPTPALAVPLTPQPSIVGSESLRYTKEDLISNIKREDGKVQPTSSTKCTSTPPLSPSERETRKPLSRIRRVIASRLVEALQNTAMLTTFNEVDMSHIIALREKYKESFAKKNGVKLGFMSFFIKASVSALQTFPDINSYIDGSDLIVRNYYDISVAVGTERGVVVPVIRGCDRLSFAEIEGALEGYAKKARTGGLVVDDLQGGGFTITNGGTYGSMLSTPILNMPQSAILGMHKIEKRAVVVDDQIVIRPIMYLALSYDHRVVDGKEAVSFLVHIKNMLEDPTRMLIDI